MWFNLQKDKARTKRSSLFCVEASLTKEKKSFMVLTTTTAAAAAVILINKTGVSICAFRQTGERVKIFVEKEKKINKIAKKLTIPRKSDATVTLK